MYHCLPDWAQRSVRNRKCTRCSKLYKKSDVVAVGIRSLDTDRSKMEPTLYVEHLCSNCDYRAITTVIKENTGTLEGLCFSILENIKHKRLLENSKKFGKRKKENPGPITDAEVKKFLKSMNDSSTHADFLKIIKASPLGDEKENNDTS